MDMVVARTDRETIAAPAGGGASAFAAFDNSYARELGGAYVPWKPAGSPKPALLQLNEALALELGLDAQALASAEGLAVLAGNAVPAGAEPLAQAYAGHAYAVFAHCFSCGKNSPGAVRISRALAAKGIATLRFDFTGLGDSEGEFGHAGFAADVADLVAAAHWLGGTHGEPALLVGHSLGGTAALLAARELHQIKAVCTIGSPSTASHLLRHLVVHAPRGDGALTVTVGGRTFPGGALVHRTAAAVAAGRGGRPGPGRPDPAFAQGLDRRARGRPAAVRGRRPRGAQLRQPGRHRSPAHPRRRCRLRGRADRRVEPARCALGRGSRGRAGGHHLDADEPVSAGGKARGPTPYDLVLMALGACTSMTLRLSAKRKGYALQDVQVRLEHERLHAQDCEQCEGREGKVERITRRLLLRGPLSEQQRADLQRIADRCPVHRTLEGQPVIVTQLVRDA
jgi:putative redox protein